VIPLNYRVLGIGVLLLLLTGVCVQYAATDHWSYPGTEDIASDPEASDGEVVFLFGRVQAADGTSEQLVVRSGTETEIELIVRDVPATVTERVEVGSSVQIYGTLREGSSAVVAEAVVVDFGDGTDRLYAYGTSILGGILAALYFLRYWRVDLRTLRFRPRGDP
jgi:hypothetical protein